LFWPHSGSAGAGRAGGRRPLLSGDIAQIREHTKGLTARGVTEIFYDLDWDRQVGSPDPDPVAATEPAALLLEALAPASQRPRRSAR